MPALASPATFRLAYSCNHYLSLFQPTAVFRCRVNMATATYPTNTLTYDGVSLGSTSDLLKGMLVTVGSSQDASDRGQIVLKSWTGATLVFGQFSRGDEPSLLNLVDNSYVSVWDMRIPFTKKPRINGSTGVQYRWGDDTWSLQNASPPVINAGGDYANFVDPDTNVITVEFFAGDLSFATADGATMDASGYTADLVDGTIVSGTEASGNFVAEFPAGQRVVRITGEDTEGSVGYKDVLIIAHERTGANAPIPVDGISSHIIRADGQELSAVFNTSIPESTYLDGIPAILWSEERYGGTLGSLAGREGREHVKGTFYHVGNKDTIQATEEGVITSVTMNFVDIAGRLKTIACFPQRVTYNVSPDTYFEVSGLNIDRYVAVVLQQNSNALELADFEWSNTGNDYSAKELESGQTSSLWEQAAMYTPGMGYMLTCSTGGLISMKPDPLMRDVSDRTSTVMLTITEADIENLEYDYSRVPVLHWFRAGAITNNIVSPQPLFAIAPGTVPGEGVQLQENFQQLIQDADEILVRAKEAYARANSKFKYLRLTMIHNGDAGIEPAFGEWLKLSVSSRYLAQRGLTFPTDTRFLVVEVSVSYEVDNESGALLTKRTYTLERETFGLGSQLYTPPTNSAQPASPPQVIYAEDVEVTGSSTGLVVVITQSGSLWRTSNFNDLEPTWTEYALGAGTLVDFTSDPFVSGAGWLFTTTEIHRITNILSGTPSTALKYTYSSATVAFTGSDHWAVQGYASATDQNDVLAIINFTGAAGGVANTMYSVHTTDDSSYSANGSLTGATTPDSAATPVGITLSKRTVGAARISRRTGASTAVIATLTSNYGSIANTAISTGTTHSYCMHEPIAGNSNGNILYYSHFDSGGSTRAIKRLASDGTTVTDVTPVNSAAENCYAFGKNAIASCSTNRLYMACIGIDDNDDAALFVASDGATWTQRSSSLTDRYDFYTSVIMQSNANVLWLYGYDGLVGYSDDNGVTIQDKSLASSSRVIGMVIGD